MLLQVVVAHRLLLFENTLNNSAHLTKVNSRDGAAVRAIHPRPEGQGFLRRPDKNRAIRAATRATLQSKV